MNPWKATKFCFLAQAASGSTGPVGATGSAASETEGRAVWFCTPSSAREVTQAQPSCLEKLRGIWVYSSRWPRALVGALHGRGEYKIWGRWCSRVEGARDPTSIGNTTRPTPHRLHNVSMLVFYEQKDIHRLIEGRGGETSSGCDEDGGAHLGSGTNDHSDRSPPPESSQCM